jgi:hypothetical protein
MKKFFLAFSIVLSFSFSWAESDRTVANPGTDRKEAMATDGGGVKEAGNKGVCADCAKHAFDGRLFDDTVKRSDGSIINDKEGGSKAEDGTR